MARRPLVLSRALALATATAFFCAQLLLPGSAAAEMSVKLRADKVESDRQTGVSTATGNVRLEVQGVVITTDRLEFNQNEKVVSTDTPFVMVQQGTNGKVQTVTGTSLHYSLKTEEAVVQGAKLEVPAQTPGQIVYITGKELVSHGRREFEIKEGTFTTCDFVSKQETPHYHTENGWIKYVPDDYAMGTNVRVFMNNRPVFWVPWFYIPLKRRESSVSIGKNNVEGLFVKSTMAYRLNERHSGNVFLNGLEFKAPGGIGFDHVWENTPNSITAFTLYGLPMPDLADYVPGTPTPNDPDGAYASTNPWVVHRLDPANPHYFQDHYWRVRHQQRLFGQMTLDGWYEDRNMYDLARIGPTYDRATFQPSQPYRDDHIAWYAGVTDNRLGLNYGANRNFREIFDFSHSRTVNDTANIGGTYGGTNFSARTNRTEQANLPAVVVRPPGAPTPAPTTAPTNTTQNSNLQLTQTFTSDLRLTSTTDHTRNQYPSQPLQERLTQSADLTQNLGWGNARLSATKLFNLAIPATASFEQRQQAIASLGYVDKLPELSISSNPLLEQYQPFTLSGVYGRYIEDSAYEPDPTKRNPRNPAQVLEPVTRVKMLGELTSKPLDLGLGAKLNFGSTGYEQRYYSTGDAEYRLTGQAALTNEFTKFFNTSLTYHRDYTPPTKASESPLWTPFGLTGRNSSPFKQFESLSLSKNHTLNGAANAVVADVFSWNNTLGYNYEIKRYTPYNTGLTFKPSRRINLTVNTGYTFADKEYLEFGTGKWQDISSTVHLQSNEEGFGGVYGQDHLQPGWSFDSTLVWSVDMGEWRAFSNKLTLETGTTWQDHWALVAEGQYDLTLKRYDLLSIGINKDLHDFILSVTYNKRLDAYTLNLAMVAFPTNLVNLSNKTFGSLGDPSQLGSQFGMGTGTF
ncbi:LPS-assembly protein LptD [bacterium]|nr:LPS-assembly protein LptD [bacterium]